jgi:hypothetical protein
MIPTKEKNEFIYNLMMKLTCKFIENVKLEHCTNKLSQEQVDSCTKLTETFYRKTYLDWNDDKLFEELTIE